jgi:S-adenosyl methyltransferase
MTPHGGGAGDPLAGPAAHGNSAPRNGTHVMPDGDFSRMLRDLDTSRPNIARVYDYLLGGKDNFAADREAGDQVLRIKPGAVTGARENRAFLGRAVRYLAAEAGIRQFLDIGTGVPAANNVHEVAQAVAPDSKVIYVDNDRAGALLTSSPAGRTAYIEADLRDPEAILAQARKTLDFRQPVALMLVAILHFIADIDDPHAIVAQLVGALPSGSYVVISATSLDGIDGDELGGLRAQYDKTLSSPLVPRSAQAIGAFFAGLDLVAPGVVPVHEWRYATGDTPSWKRGDAVILGGIGRKP